MTQNEITLVRQGFDRIAPSAEQVGLQFYDRLFALDTSLRTLFRGDMRTQAGHLMAALGMVVRSLDDLAPVLERIQALARRHVAYGVRPHHFATVGAAFLATLQAGLGDAFTPEARAAWTRAYETLAGTMLAAMYDVRPDDAPTSDARSAWESIRIPGVSDDGRADKQGSVSVRAGSQFPNRFCSGHGSS